VVLILEPEPAGLFQKKMPFANNELNIPESNVPQKM
jgi:hypothetical protein